MIREKINPFEYDNATYFSVDEILDYYIEDYNYSRFVESSRNVFLIGERGSGKTMTLLYNAHRFKKTLTKEKVQVGVYIPCKTPLMYKKEYELEKNDKYKAAIISEHLLVLTISFHFVKTLLEYGVSIDDAIDKELKKDIQYTFNWDLPKDKTILEALKIYINRETVGYQKVINELDINKSYQSTYSFFSLVLPLINFFRKIPTLSNCHFHFMLDDAHDLNKHQIRALNSWIAYRDHSGFSFKVSSAKIKRPESITSTGGSILEGHDYLSIDMEEPFQNRFSDFGKLARGIVKRRLNKIGAPNDPDVFFPINQSMLRDLDKSEKIVRKKAEEKFGKKEGKQISDWVYKYKRAEYFRSRSSKSNIPPYSGFETIVHLSTGVVRNLLYPCYWMYEKAISESGGESIDFIKPAIQTDVIKEKSKELWTRINKKLHDIVEDCSTEDARKISSLFENLAILFTERLKQEISEPRAIAFSISSYDENHHKKLERLLRISQEAQILYTRVGSAKDSGRKEIYYVPNRMLWPIYGLDPVGQHARVSLKAKDVWAAANGTRFPFVAEAFDRENNLFTGGISQ